MNEDPQSVVSNAYRSARGSATESREWSEYERAHSASMERETSRGAKRSRQDSEESHSRYDRSVRSRRRVQIGSRDETVLLNGDRVADGIDDPLSPRSTSTARIPVCPYPLSSATSSLTSLLSYSPNSANASTPFTSIITPPTTRYKISPISSPSPDILHRSPSTRNSHVLGKPPTFQPSTRSWHFRRRRTNELSSRWMDTTSSIRRIIRSRLKSR